MHLGGSVVSVCICGERSCAPECADKLVKWGVVPSGTLTHCVSFLAKSHCHIAYFIPLLNHFRVHTVLMQ